MKVLFTASVTGHIEAFHLPYLRYFKEKGFEVHTAAKGVLPYADRHFDIDFQRSPFKISNIACYSTLKKIIEENKYDIIHCHTPVVGVLTRLAARKLRKNGTKVFYTAHGFHFYNGAPLLQAMLFRFAEKMLSRYTDCLITMNEEDFNAVKKYGFKPGSYYMVPGVGVDSSKFHVQTQKNKAETRKQLGISSDAYVLVFAAELSQRKNQHMLIQAANLLKQNIPGLLLLLPGNGPLQGKYEEMIKAGKLQENVRLMGYRRDMDTVLLTADIAVSSSLQEGLPINIVEAMAVSLPVVATRIRGHSDLIKHGLNGFLVDTGNITGMADKLLYLYEHPQIIKNMRKDTLERVKPYLLENARQQTVEIYEEVLQKKQNGAR